MIVTPPISQCGNYLYRPAALCRYYRNRVTQLSGISAMLNDIATRVGLSFIGAIFVMTAAVYLI
ncbi:MAG: hypothetical protein ACI8PT_001904 [Gammaproteobacteria bacterium]|jgi:hypothetical protein